MSNTTGILFGTTFLFATVVFATDRLASIHLILAYLLLTTIVINLYDHDYYGSVSVLLSLQIVLMFALGIAIIGLFDGGFSFRAFELGTIFALVVMFVFIQPDPVEIFPNYIPYITAFAVLFGIFLYHARSLPADSGMGLFPVFAGILLAFNLFVIPQYVSQDAFYWSVSIVAASAAIFGFSAIVYGNLSIWIFEVRTWSNEVPLLFSDREVPVIRSIFANPNTFGLLLFPGVVASMIATHHTLIRSSFPVLTVVPAGCFIVTTVGLYLSNSRASIGAAIIAIVLYVIITMNRRLAPVAILCTGTGVVVLLAGISASILPLNPANRFALWHAGFNMIQAEGSVVGEGLVSTRDAIEPYLDGGGGSVHNSYLSIFIRTGLLGGLAYLVLVIGPICHGMIRYNRVNVGMLALASGFAVHQLFEGYTLYQFGPGSILGALVVGYVIASIASSPEQPTETAIEARITDILPSIEWIRHSRDRHQAGDPDRQS